MSEQINNLMRRFDRTEQRATINTGMLVYNYYIFRHNTRLENEQAASASVREEAPALLRAAAHGDVNA